MSALVSICIPAYHADKYISKALSSVREQTFTDWELIVTEDGSKDKIEQIVLALANEVKQNVIYKRHESNQGLPATRNTCVSVSKGRYIAFLDSDDYWKSDHLSIAIELFNRENPDIVYSGSIMFDSQTGQSVGYREPNTEELKNFDESLFERTFFQPSSVVMKKDSLLKVGMFDNDMRFCEDAELWYRCLRANMRFCYTGHRTCYYRLHSNAMTRKGELMAEYIAILYKRQLDWCGISKKLRRQKVVESCAAAGKILFRNHPEKSARFFFDAWLIRPTFLIYPILILAALGRKIVWRK